MLPSPVATTPGCTTIDNLGSVSDPVFSKAGAAKDLNPATSSFSCDITFNPPCTSSVEDWMRQIFVELRAIKLSQEEAHKETKDQLSQLNTHLTHLSARLSLVEKRVSDLEDLGNQSGSTIPQIQSELEELQMKLEDLENRSQCLNLRFTGIPEAAKIVSDLIRNTILPETAKTDLDLSIMRAHWVLFVRLINPKYLCNILVHFGDSKIKEQILSQTIKKRIFKSGDLFSFRVFSDMSASAAKRRCDFVGLIDDFKQLGAPAGIVQLAKLKV
ncbi:hypothetical protein NDU88_000043 [Pleurodeles waltl]|uniref:Uncharacterized protein n=1 Tax=Pleurodeles waltl TaxID=8319 RepID=A0AAV7UQQ4_PLEWA|nr:hypothetical protein NDU88_000043 [Pleurodeles waltl]